MLQEMTAEEFEERFAWHLISGEGEQRQFVALLASVVVNQVTRAMAANAGQPLKPEQVLPVDEFLPELFRTKAKKKTGIRATDPQAAERAARQLGIL